MSKRRSRINSDVDKFADVFNVISREFQSTLTKLVDVINTSMATADIKKSEKDFYPEDSTAFFKPGPGSQDKLLTVVELDEDVNCKVGTVNFTDSSGEECFWDDWLGSVRSGVIEVVYCPSMGRVSSNEDYLKYWGLSR